jgi:hypothetical protein
MKRSLLLSLVKRTTTLAFTTTNFRSIVCCLLLVSAFSLAGNEAEGQVINENFDESAWTTLTTSTTGRYTDVTSIPGVRTISYFTGANSTVTTWTNTSPNSGTWIYSKASQLTTETKLNKSRSKGFSLGLGSGSGYIATPIISGGVTSISFWAAPAGNFQVGMNTNSTAAGSLNITNTTAVPTYSSNASANIGGYTYFTQSYASNGSAGNTSMQFFSFTTNFTGSFRVGFFNASGSTVYIDDIIVSTNGGNAALSSSNPAAPSTGASQGTTKNLLYSFNTAVTEAPLSFSSVNFTTTGTYAASDITKFQLWSNTINDLGTATQLGSDIVAALGAGSHTFSSLAQIIQPGITQYYWITSDVSGSATINNNISVSTIATSDLTFTNGTKSGSAFAGGTITFKGASSATDNFRSRMSGNWSSVTTWESSPDNGANWQSSTLVPNNSTVPILVRDGNTVTLDQSASAASLTVGEGTSGVFTVLTSAVASSNYALTIAGNVTVATGGSVTGSVPTNNNLHVISIGGNLTVNGTYTFSGTSSSTKAINTTFIGSVVTISGVGTVGFHTLTVNLATPTTTITPSVNITTASSGLILTQGKWVQGTNTTTTTGSSTFGLSSELSIEGGTFTHNAGTINWSGNITVSSGTLNVGSAVGNSMAYLLASPIPTYTQTGGIVNIAGRFSYNGSLVANQDINFNMSGGTMTVGTVDNSGNTATFDIPSAGSIFTMSGGTIVIQTHSSGITTPNDYRNVASTQNITGGTVQFGNASTPAATTFQVAGQSSATTSYAPNVVINTTNSPTVSLIGSNITDLVIKGNLTINTGTTLNANAKNIALTGDWNNSGTFTSTGSTVTFNGSGAQGITKAGGETFNNLTLSNASNITLNNALTIDGGLNVTTGTLTTGANNITLNASVGSAIFEAGTTLNINNAGSTVDFNNRPVYFRSGAGGTARIAKIVGTLSDATVVVAERYIPSRRAWRLLTAPVTGTTLNTAWQEGLINPDVNTNLPGTTGFGTHITGQQQEP